MTDCIEIIRTNKEVIFEHDFFSEPTKTPYNPIDQNIYTSCEDAFTRGGIRPNADEPIQILSSDGTTKTCSKERVREGVQSFCPPGTYESYSKCISVHDEYVTNDEASRYYKIQTVLALLILNNRTTNKNTKNYNSFSCDL